jgi:hypothetical protein
MVELSVVRDLVAIFSFVIGLTYYIMVLQNQQKNQKHAQETRKIQLLTSHNEHISEEGGLARWYALMSMQWDDYDDFISKYGYGNNPELSEVRMEIWRAMNQNGLLIRDGLIDTQSYVHYIGTTPPLVWKKFKDIIETQRVLFDNPEHFIGIEILANEVDKYRSEMGLPPQEFTDTR